MFTQIHDTQHQATAITKEAGFIISADEINQTQTMVSDEELMAVNGGGGGECKIYYDLTSSDCLSY